MENSERPANFDRSRLAWRDVHVACAVLAVGLYVIGKLSGHHELYIVADVIVLITIFHFFINSYFYRQRKFLIDNERAYSLPKKKISKAGGLFLGGFLILLGVAMAVVKEIYDGTLLAKLQAMVAYLFAKMSEAIIGTGGLGRDDLQFQDYSNLIGAMDGVTQNGDSPLQDVINTIQTILVIVGIVAILVLCIVLIVNYIRRTFGAIKTGGSAKAGADVSDREERIQGSGSLRERLLDFSPNAKVRRLYRRSINRERKRGQVLPNWMTPSEIENVVFERSDDSNQVLHEIYERARYSEDGCTDDDVRRAKAL